MGESVKLNNVVGCFPHLYQPHSAPGTDNPKYSIEAIIDPHTQDGAANLQALEKAFVAVATAAGKGDLVQGLMRPFKSGNAVNMERPARGKKPRLEIQNKWILRASSHDQPAVVDRNVAPIPEEQATQIFGGCIFNLYVDLYWSNNPTNPGIFCGLSGVQLVSNVGVERIGIGRPSLEDMFDPVTDAVGDVGVTTLSSPAPTDPPSWV